MKVDHSVSLKSCVVFICLLDFPFTFVQNTPGRRPTSQENRNFIDRTVSGDLFRINGIMQKDKSKITIAPPRRPPASGITISHTIESRQAASLLRRDFLLFLKLAVNWGFRCVKVTIVLQMHGLM